MKNLQQYIDNKKMLQGKPITDLYGDTAKSPSVKPPKMATKGKNWSDPVAVKGEQKPYGAPQVKEKGYTTAPEGFAKSGDKNLIYKPITIEKDDKKEYYSFPGEKMSTVWNQEDFSKNTKNMGLTEFTLFIKNNLMIENSKDIPKIYAFQEGEIMPDPYQAIRYTSFLAKANSKLMEMLVMEIKRNGCLGTLIEEVLRYKEGRDILERVEEPMDKELEEIKIKKKKKKKPEEEEQPIEQ